MHKQSYTNPKFLAGKIYRQHVPAWSAHGGCQAKYSCCPKFAKPAQKHCCPGSFSPGGVSGMRLAKLSPQQIRTIHQYEQDFLRRYGRSIVLLALRGTN